MKKIIYHSISFLFVINSFAQNLVHNYSFEDKTACPTGIAQINLAVPWNSPTTGTPDYFHQCGIAAFGVPQNAVGYQYARTGIAYAGMGAYANQSPNNREYVYAQLADSLMKGKKYCIIFFVNLANESQNSINSFGVYLSKDSINIPNYLVLPYIPQISNSSSVMLNDTTDWVAISGSFIAVGGEKYITIGNFDDDANTTVTTVNSAGISKGAYYYVDDVSVECCNCDTTQTSEIVIPNVFTPNGDGANDVFEITTKNIKELEIKIYNRWGLLVWNSSPSGRLGGAWDGKTTAGAECADGVYYYMLIAKGLDDKEYKEKGFLQLLR
ncbi:MAG: gliding motility-associated C-terminal domain-containing protein [Bacteroidota bacterium]